MDGFANLPTTDLCAVAIAPRMPDRAKRAIDLVLATACLLFVLPVFFVIAGLIKATDGGSVFYSHRRIGREGREFGCLKFRTMAENGDEVLAAYLAAHPEAEVEWREGRKLRNDPRITSIGRILRKSSLDEIPQLFNVIKGDMSLVGPRPIVAEELQMYGVRSHLYFRARPGLTGLWQVSGRSELSYETRVDLDCQYVEHCGLRDDISILIRTIPAVCFAKGSR